MNNHNKTEQQLGTVEIKQHIGFSTVPDLTRNRSMQGELEINVLVTGRRGSSASILIYSLFGVTIISKSRTSGLAETKNEIVENGISLFTTAATYRSDKNKPIIDCVDPRNMECSENEQRPYKIHEDARVHVCKYLIPSYHLQESKISFIKTLIVSANSAPVIPKTVVYTNEKLSCRTTINFNNLQERNVV